MYFLINDAAEPWEGGASFSAQGAGRQYDPQTGAIAPVADPAKVPVKLGPYGGVLFRFDKAVLPPRRPAITERQLIQ